MKRAFSMIELIFVIVVIGILAKFGTNILHTVYESFTVSVVNSKLHADAELALKQLSSRLQYRIRDSVIARDLVTPQIATLSSAAGANYTILEWVGSDIDGWLGTSRAGDGVAGVNTEPVFNRPTWSGFIEVDNANAVASSQGAAASPYLESPGTNTVLVNNTIVAVSSLASGTTIANAAIFFTGANSNIQTDYGWNGVQNFQVTTAAHRITSGLVPTQLFDATILPAAAFPPEQAPLVVGDPSSFRNTDIYENYELAWTAYAVSVEDFDGDLDDDLVMYYDYQPWQGENYLANGTRVLLMHNVDTFRASAIGDTMKIQICVNEENQLGGGLYSVCKETAIF